MKSDPATRRYNFKEQYQRAGFTINSLAAATGLNRAYISLYSQGRYNFNTDELSLLAEALDVPVHVITK